MEMCPTLCFSLIYIPSLHFSKDYIFLYLAINMAPGTGWLARKVRYFLFLQDIVVERK